MGLAVGENTVTIAAEGVSPKSLVIKAANIRFSPVWTNLDTVAHTVTFDDGRCFVTIPAGGRDGCGPSALLFAGTFRYVVSNLVDPTGEIVVVPHERRVTMVASRASARSGQAVVLHGTVFVTNIGPFGGFTPQTITVLRRVAGSRRFVVIRRVRSRFCPSPPCVSLGDAWSTTIRPRATATYVARIVDPPDKTVWKRAESRRIVIRVSEAHRSAVSPGQSPTRS